MFRSMLGRADGSSAGCRSREMEETDDAESRVDHTPLNLVCHPRDRKRHDDWRPSPYCVLVMVVTRKAPLPPTPSSRSSSSQTVPRMAKVKVNQLNQPEHSSPLASGKPRTADSMVRNRPRVCSTGFAGCTLTAHDDHPHVRLAHHANPPALHLASIWFNLSNAEPLPPLGPNSSKAKTEV